MTKYLSRAALLGALTTLEEQDITEPMLGGMLRIRELTANQRQQAEQAAFAAGGDNGANNAVYRAFILHYGLVEPALTIEDVGAITEGREEAVKRVAVAILELSEALPGSLKSRDTPPDKGQ